MDHAGPGATQAEVELLKKIDEQLAQPPTSHAAEPKRIDEVASPVEAPKEEKEEKEEVTGPLRLSLLRSQADGLNLPRVDKEEQRVSLMTSIFNDLDEKKLSLSTTTTDEIKDTKGDDSKTVSVEVPMSPTGPEVVDGSLPSQLAKSQLSTPRAPQLAPIRNPLRIFPNDPPPPPFQFPRPMTASTRRMSFSTIDSERKRRIKYGTGKHAHVELVPQPSDDPDDPLNWPSWRKALNLGSLLLMLALANSAKTALISVNAQIALEFDVSYTAAAELTGVPLMLSAFSGVGSLVAARIYGRRPVYLVATLLIFIGVVLNTQPGAGFGAFLTGRIFQGFGWGAFDTLILGSIQDTYFEHEQRIPLLSLEVANVATTWGPPLVGGPASASAAGFATQFQILAGFMALAVPAVVLGVPETAYDRSSYAITTPASAWSAKNLPSAALAPRSYIDHAKEYLLLMKPYTFSARATKKTLMQVPLALVAPTTALLFILTFLPFCALWGLASSLSLLFSPAPFNLSTTFTGELMVAPFLLSTAAVAFSTFTQRFTAERFTPMHNIATIAAGSLLAFTALLALGLYLDPFMARLLAADIAFIESPDGSGVAFSAVSFVLGLLAAGAHVLDAAVTPMVGLSTQYTSENLAVALRNTADMRAAARIWRTLVVGAFVMGVPSAVWMWEGVKGVSVGFATAQISVGAGVGAVWWFWGDVVRRVDGRVLGFVDRSLLRRSGSFFDVD